ELRVLVEILEQRGRERRMAAGIAIRREFSRQSGVGDQQRTVVLGEPRESSEAASLARAARRALREWIVAAGIEQHDLLRRGPPRRKKFFELGAPSRFLVRAV